MQLKISAIDAKKDIMFPMMMLMGKLKKSILLPIIVFLQKLVFNYIILISFLY